MNKVLPRARNQNIVIQELDAEVLIYDLESNTAFCLNPTAAMVWKHCNGNSTFAEVIDDFDKNLKQKITEDFVWLTLDHIKQNNLLERAEEFEIPFGGLTRRQLVRKVGLASMVALPLISSIIVPSAVQAQSNCQDLGGLCNPETRPCCPDLACLYVGDGFGCGPCVNSCQPCGGEFSVEDECCPGLSCNFETRLCCPSAGGCQC